MLIELIIEILDYLVENDCYLINKEIYSYIRQTEKSNYWKNKYENYFVDLKKEYLIIKKSDNYKKDYLEIKKFKLWNKIDNENKVIILNNENLDILPKELSRLEDVGNAQISSNNIKIIPDNFGDWFNLRYLNLSKNKIYNIPKDFCKLVFLVNLDLSYNNIKEIPKEISNMLSLEILFLNNNNIQIIPKELFYLPNLISIELINNKISQLPFLLCNKKYSYIDVFYLNKLSEINLENNKIKNKPKIPSYKKDYIQPKLRNTNEYEKRKIELELEFLSKLEYINLSGNNISEISILDDPKSQTNSENILFPKVFSYFEEIPKDLHKTIYNRQIVINNINNIDI